MRRFDLNGLDVTDLPGLWDESDKFVEDDPVEIDRTAITHLWSHQPERYVVTAEDAADWIMAGTANQQAALFTQLAAKMDDKDAYPVGWWPTQCRWIAESMSSDQRSAVAVFLETLTEHLRAVSAEQGGAKQ